jgi:hypothetical protein
MYNGFLTNFNETLKKENNMGKTIYQKGAYRILELKEIYIDLKELKGDCYKPECNHDVSPKLLKSQELVFETKCYEQGVYGYVLEVWDADIGQGWTHVDSCFGFVGTHEDENHYIVDELKRQIKKAV